jgi:hypothetical protein
MDIAVRASGRELTDRAANNTVRTVMPHPEAGHDPPGWRPTPLSPIQPMAHEVNGFAGFGYVKGDLGAALTPEPWSPRGQADVEGPVGAAAGVGRVIIGRRVVVPPSECGQVALGCRSAVATRAVPRSWNVVAPGCQLLKSPTTQAVWPADSPGTGKRTLHCPLSRRCRSIMRLLPP